MQSYHYYYHANSALRAITALKRQDINTLIVLSYFERPISLRPLYDALCIAHNAITLRRFYPHLNNLVAMGYVSRKRGYKHLYYITPSGRLLLFQFAAALDKIVQEKLKEFGTDDDSL